MNYFAITIRFQGEQDFSGVDFVGGLVDVKTADNIIWEWIVVDHQLDDVIILPFRRNGDERTSGVQLITGDEYKYMNRTDRGNLEAAVPVAMRCIRVGDRYIRSWAARVDDPSGPAAGIPAAGVALRPAFSAAPSAPLPAVGSDGPFQKPGTITVSLRTIPTHSFPSCFMGPVSRPLRSLASHVALAPPNSRGADPRAWQPAGPF